MKNNFCLSFFLLLIPLTGCVTNQKVEKQPLSNTKLPQQAPSILKPPIMETKGNESKNNTSQIIEEMAFIETSFLSQNCDSVLEHIRLLQSLYPSIDMAKQPPIVRAAAYTCDAKAGLKDPVRLNQAIVNLKLVPLKYPFINEAWLHNTIGDFYIALNDIPNALIEKKLSRDLLLAQQQDISSLNADILKLDPKDYTVAPQNNSPSPSLNVDQIIASATQLINNDSADQAIALLDTIPAAQKTDQVKRLRTEAVTSLVTNLRFKVRALFVRSTEQTGAAKKESLLQCEQILKGILQNYPEYQDISAIQNNLKQVQRELNGN